MMRLALTALVVSLSALPAWAINGNSIALRSSSSVSGSAAVLNDNGYVGTYVTLPAAGPVTIRVNARGTAAGGVDPHMNIVVNDSRMGWDVSASDTNYEYAVNLPAGTHFIRTEFNNDRATGRSLQVNSLEVSGAAALVNVNSTANALAAAETYTQNYRKGDAKVSLVGVAPGAQVHVSLKKHDYNFGVAIPNSFTDTFLVPPNSPGADPGAAQFQQALVDNRFNSLTAGNAGKWDATEGTRDVVTTKQPPAYAAPYVYMDRIAQFAAENDMGYRAHNVIWGANGSGANNQQPGWAHTMITNPNGTDTYNAGSNPQGTNLSNKDALFSDLVAPAGTPNAGEPSEIHERIKYYAQDRAQQFYDIDVYNESYHTGSNNPSATNTYWDVYGASGIAKMYKLTKDAIVAGGGNANTYVNEYSVLQQQGGDYFANWYTRHIEDIQNAGKDLYGEAENVVTGVGFQYYASSTLSNHDSARVYATMQNLAVQGLPMALTEFGVGNNSESQTAQKEADAAVILEQTARLVFGMPGSTGFTQWDLRDSGAFAKIGTFYNADWSLRAPGAAWQELMDEWNTDLMATVGADGTIAFNGFFGDYEITVDGQTLDLALAKGDAAYSLVVAAGDYNADGIVDAADYTVWRDTLGSIGDLRADGNGNEMIDDGDFDVWKAKFGTAYGSGSGSGLATVPEPASGVLLAMGGAIGWGLRRRKVGR